MWVTSWEKNEASRRANFFQKRTFGDDWWINDHYRERDPNIIMKVSVYNHICFLVRETLKTMVSPQATMPEAYGIITPEYIRMELGVAGVEPNFIPDDMWLKMFIQTLIPSFLQRNKEYEVREDVDESLPPEFFDFRDKRYAIIKGEACIFNREFKGWELYKGIYPMSEYFHSDFQNYGWGPTYKCIYRAYEPVNDFVLKGYNLADIKQKVGAYMRGEINE